MRVQPGPGRGHRFDRRLLLFGTRRDQVLQLWEVQRYGRDSYGDADYVSIYGMPPALWYARGVRLLGRTAVECTRDRLADLIGQDVAAVAQTAPHPAGVLVVDPFAGSANTLYWISRHLPAARAVGFERDPGLFAITRRNLDAVTLTLQMMNTDCARGLAGLDASERELVVAFLAPPWGKALNPVSGLDLRRTNPPVTGIVDLLTERYPRNPLLCAIQIHEKLDPASAAELSARLDWSEIRIYDLNAPGENHGILIGTRSWNPPPAPRL
jgi:16S rRNA G966 N2-methylase RsmD